MSTDSTASPTCSRFLSRPALPPFLRLTTQENVGPSNLLGGHKFNIKSLGQTFQHIVFPRESGMGNRLVAGTTVEDEDAVCITRTTKLTKRGPTGRHSSRPSTTSIVSQLTASTHISAPRSPRTLITSFPPLNVSDVPPRSPTNKSPFSAILLSGGDEGREDDDPVLALWHTEQVHRARLAKLTRHLGEEVPAELVLSPVFLSRGTSCSPIHSRRGGHHHKHKSLDPSSSMRKSCVAGSTEGSLRRSKSLMERSDSHCTLMSSATGFTPKMPSTEYIASEVCNTETTIHIEPILNPIPPPCTTPEARYSTSLMNTSNGDVLHERVSMNPYSVSSPCSSPPPDETAGPASAYTHFASCTPPEPTVLPWQPATVDPSRRVEKLENFFGVTHNDLSACGTALQCSSANATGDLAIGIHARESQLEVEIKVIKPVRFWNSRAMTQSIRPGDVIDQLRMMKAS